jgi:hypothetical protein
MIPKGRRALPYSCRGFRKRGWSVGRNVQVDLGAGDFERYRKYAAELIALAPDVVLAAGVPIHPVASMPKHSAPLGTGH